METLSLSLSLCLSSSWKDTKPSRQTQKQKKLFRCDISHLSWQLVCFLFLFFFFFDVASYKSRDSFFLSFFLSFFFTFIFSFFKDYNKTAEWIFGTYKLNVLTWLELNVLTWLELLLLCMRVKKIWIWAQVKNHTW